MSKKQEIERELEELRVNLHAQESELAFLQNEYELKKKEMSQKLKAALAVPEEPIPTVGNISGFAVPMPADDSLGHYMRPRGYSAQWVAGGAEKMQLKTPNVHGLMGVIPKTRKSLTDAMGGATVDATGTPNPKRETRSKRKILALRQEGMAEKMPPADIRNLLVKAGKLTQDKLEGITNIVKRMEPSACHTMENATDSFLLDFGGIQPATLREIEKYVNWCLQ